MKLRIDPPLRAAALTLALLASLPAAVPAASLWLDDPPWRELESPSAVALAADVLDDPRTGWHVAAGTLTATLARREGRTLYARWSHLSFSQPGGRLAARWPELLSDELDADEAESWPGEARLSGWGRPEVGAVGALALPGLGPSAYAASVWLPMAEEALYPFAARALSLRLSLRRELSVAPGILLGLEAGRILTAGLSDGVLADAAFPGGGEAGADLGWRRGGVLLRAGYRTGRAGQTGWRAEASLPVGPGRVRADWELVDADPETRLYRTRLRLGWSLPLPPLEETEHDPEPER
ncbi:MAG TPA: hypothetical protein PLH84_10275 [Candidatus Krumholzibacteria bacterium]|nr:hypothetical protein [Candidatus Krumholzibacteria bacterium]